MILTQQQVKDWSRVFKVTGHWSFFSENNCNSSCSQVYEDINTYYKRDKEKYILWEGAPYWSSTLKVSQYVDVIMHFMFLGVTNTT